MTRPSVIIGDILAVWEDVADHSAREFHQLAEYHALRILRDGVTIAEDASKADRVDAERKQWVEVQNARDHATAYRIISNGLRRYLRILNVPTYGKRRADEANKPMAPWEHRRAHEAMGPNVDAPKHERANVVLNKDKLESTAREYGLWKDETDEPQK